MRFFDIFHFHDLRVLGVAYNFLHGVNPQFVTNLTELNMLDLSNNNCNGNMTFNLDKILGYTINVFRYGSNIKLFHQE